MSLGLTLVELSFTGFYWVLLGFLLAALTGEIGNAIDFNRFILADSIAGEGWNVVESRQSKDSLLLLFFN